MGIINKQNIDTTEQTLKILYRKIEEQDVRINNLNATISNIIEQLKLCERKK